MEDELLPLYREIGRQLRKARDVADKTQQEAAGQLGVTDGMVSNYESGRHAISIDKVLILAEFYGIEPAVLLPLNRLAKFAYRRRLWRAAEESPRYGPGEQGG